MATNKLQTFATKPRIFILSDMSKESSGAASLCRYLLYSNQFTTEGLVACTSTWMKSKVCPQEFHHIIDAYANTVDNLNAHVHPDHVYPSADSLRGLVRKGAETYGMTSVGDNIPLSEGGQLLYDRILAPSPQPLWVLCWGGTNTLAQTLYKMDDIFSQEDAQRLMSRLRVYTISDQDDSAAWIRTNFSDIFYISSVHGWNQYGMAAWTGISGEHQYGFDQGGPDFSKMDKQWIKENIQIGPLGKAYPDYLTIPEGDTPTFLYLIQNGLNTPEFPNFGSWGGRYTRTDISVSVLSSNHYSDAVDRVTGQDGKTYTSSHATIWRWRDAFQTDFAARIQWTLSPDFSKVNHHPVVCVNGDWGLHPLRLEAEAGAMIALDASKSYDPDAEDKMTFKWWHYREPTATQWQIDAEISLLAVKSVDAEGKKVEATLPPPERCAVDLTSRQPVAKGQLLHLILEVSDNGMPALMTYRRVLIQVTNKDLRGGEVVDTDIIGATYELSMR
jgi:hypothetical protein